MARILVAAMAFDAERGGGSVRLAYELSTGLARRGHQMTVVCEDLFAKRAEHEMQDGVTILSYRLPRPGGLGFRRHLEHIRAVKNLVAKYLPGPPDIVHGHHLFQYAAVLDLFRDQSRCFYSIHSPATDELKIAWGAQRLSGKVKSLFGLSIIEKLEASILLRSSGLTAESRFTSDLIACRYGRAVSRKIKIIPGWANPQNFQPIHQDQVEPLKRQLNFPTDVPLFFVLRRLEPRMGLDNLLHALALVKKRGFNPHTVIGGDGSLKTDLAKLRDDLGLKNDVAFMGFVPTIQLHMAYGVCNASIIPTAQLECFGIIALEALACGRTTLVTPVGALPEVIANFEPQWIARDATPDGIADLLVAFLLGHLPTHPPQELYDGVMRKYSFQQALLAYEQFMHAGMPKAPVT